MKDKYGTSGRVDHADESTQSIQCVLGDKLETNVKSCERRIQSVDKWETSAKSCGPEHSEHPYFTGRPDQGTQSIQSVLGDK